jgi:hypothetical protein
MKCAGIPGCGGVSNVSVFLPLKDKFEEIDPQILAKRIAELGGVQGAEEDYEAEIDDRDTIGVQVFFNVHHLSCRDT